MLAKQNRYKVLGETYGKLDEIQNTLESFGNKVDELELEVAGLSDRISVCAGDKAELRCTLQTLLLALDEDGGPNLHNMRAIIEETLKKTG